MEEDGLSREEAVKAEQRHSHLFEMADLERVFRTATYSYLEEMQSYDPQHPHKFAEVLEHLKGKKRSNANASTTITTNIMVNFEPEPSQPLFFLQCFLD